MWVRWRLHLMFKLMLKVVVGGSVGCIHLLGRSVVIECDGSDSP